MAFQFTPLREGRPFCGGRKIELVDFNSRPSARGDCLKRCLKMLPGRFQFTPLREGRRAMSVEPLRLRLFQFTPLREGRHRAKATAARMKRFQFTPLREGRREYQVNAPEDEDISIHAPPRGATRGRMKRMNNEKNFNSRPSARGDERLTGFISLTRYFNSRPSARGDFSVVKDAPHCQSISIHAPPRGATRCRHSCRHRRRNFNSRPSARGDAADF